MPPAGRFSDFDAAPRPGDSNSAETLAPPPRPSAPPPVVPTPRPAAWAADAATVAPAPPPPPAPADDVRRVGGYEVVREIGRGGMGVVYEARDPRLGRTVALKMVLNAAHASAEELARFDSEARAVAKLRHPNVVQIYEVGEADGRPFFALEYLAGGSLADRLDGAPLPPLAAAAVAECLARAVQAAHAQGIVHRDIKPANVLLRFPDGAADPGRGLPAGAVPVLTDFGLAKNLSDDAGRTGSGTIMGTPSYMAPEQAAGDAARVGPLADVYALGAVLYDLLTGRPPFVGDTLLETLTQVRESEPVAPARLRPQLPLDLQTICLKCLEKAPGRRYASADALADDLRRFRAGEPILARPVGSGERLLKWARRRPGTAALVGAVAALVLALSAGGAGAALYFRHQAAELGFALNHAEGQKHRAEASAEAARKERGRGLEAFQETVGAMSLVLRQVGNDVGRDEVLRTAEAGYERLARIAGGAGLAAERATARGQVGCIRLLRGDPASAREALAESVALWGAAADGPDARGQLGRITSRLAIAMAGLGDPAAGRTFDDALRLLGDPPAADPAAVEVGLLQINRGLWHRRAGRPAEAAACYDDAARRLRGAADAARPGESDAAALLALALSGRGAAARAAGDPAAEGYLTEAARRLAALRATAPASPLLDRLWADVRTDLAAVRAAAGRADEAEAAFADAEAVLRRLAADPEEHQAAADLAAHLSEHAVALDRAGDFDRAAALLRESAALREKLAASRPGAAARCDLAGCRLNLGKVHSAAGRPGDAERAYLSAADAVGAPPDGPDGAPARRLLFDGAVNLARLAEYRGEREKAGAQLRRAAALAAALERDEPTPASAARLAAARLELARWLGRAGQPGPAADAFADAAAGLAERDPAAAVAALAEGAKLDPDAPRRWPGDARLAGLRGRADFRALTTRAAAP